MFHGVKMKRIQLSIILIATVILIVACNNSTNQNTTTNNNAQTKPTTAPSVQPTTDVMAEAKTLYADNCADCHKPDGGGGTVTIKKKTIKPPSLKTGDIVKDPDADLIKIITNGKENMPSFKDDLSAEQIKSLVQFIRKEFQNK
jgi:mono/diheme cytochrome c family protein